MTEQGGSDGLGRFLEAQAPVIDAVMAELARGRKETHWMWFVFPQLRGLGRSATAWRFGLADLAEARAYAAHPVLGPRLRAAAELEFERQRWMDAAGQVKAVEAIGARWDAEQQRMDQRREQLDTDERARRGMHQRSIE